MRTPIANFDLSLYEIKKFFSALEKYTEFQTYFLYSIPAAISAAITLIVTPILNLKLVPALGLLCVIAVILYPLGYLLGKGKWLELNYLQARTQYFSALFKLLATKLDVGQNLEGYIDCSSFKSGLVVKSRPYVQYYEFEWCLLSFKLKNGNDVHFKLTDRVQIEQGQAPLILNRQIEVKLADDDYEMFLYETYLDKFQRRKSKHNIPLSTSLLGNESTSLASRTVEALEPAIKKIRRSKKKNQEEEEFDKTIQTERHEIFLNQSKLSGMISSKSDKFRFLIRFMGRKLDLEAIQLKGVLFSILSIPMPHLKLENAESLLKANSSMAYARFAYDGKQIVLLKSLIYETLDQEELDTAIQGMGKLASVFTSLKEIQNRVKKSSHVRDQSKELALIKKALTRVNAAVKVAEDNYEVTVTLPSGRTQIVYINFDRRDVNGEPLIVVLTQCGLYDDKHNEDLLKQNIKPGYGAMGIQKIEGEQHFVVTDCQLAATVDALELSGLILNLATKGDRLEKKLSTEDKY